MKMKTDQDAKASSDYQRREKEPQKTNLGQNNNCSDYVKSK